jgi:hypothetical protein
MGIDVSTATKGITNAAIVTKAAMVYLTTVILM